MNSEALAILILNCIIAAVSAALALAFGASWTQFGLISLLVALVLLFIQILLEKILEKR